MIDKDKERWRVDISTYFTKEPTHEMISERALALSRGESSQGRVKVKHIKPQVRPKPKEPALLPNKPYKPGESQTYLYARNLYGWMRYVEGASLKQVSEEIGLSTYTTRRILFYVSWMILGKANEFQGIKGGLNNSDHKNRLHESEGWTLSPPIDDEDEE